MSFEPKLWGLREKLCAAGIGVSVAVLGVAETAKPGTVKPYVDTLARELGNKYHELTDIHSGPPKQIIAKPINPDSGPN